MTLAKWGGKSGLQRAGRPGVVLGDFMFKREGRKVPQKIDRLSKFWFRGLALCSLGEEG